MANAALFFGWGQPARGRERQAMQVFGEAMQHFAELQRHGEIESFEAVALEPHGGDLQGFILVRGDREKLNRLRHSQETLRLNARAGYIIDGFGVVGAFIGDEMQQMYANYQQVTADLA